MTKSALLVITMVAVASSMIAAIGHDAETSTLRVEFNNGATYDYPNVNTDLFKNLSEAASVGAFFTANIKKHPEKYPATKMEVVSQKVEAKPKVKSEASDKA